MVPVFGGEFLVSFQALVELRVMVLLSCVVFVGLFLCLWCGARWCVACEEAPGQLCRLVWGFLFIHVGLCAF